MGNPSFALSLCHVLQPLAQTEERSVERKFYPILFKSLFVAKGSASQMLIVLPAFVRTVHAQVKLLCTNFMT